MANVPDGLTHEERAGFLRDLRDAYYSGVSRVRFREREVFYRSLAEMKEVIDDLQQAQATTPRQRVVHTTFNRGY